MCTLHKLNNVRTSLKAYEHHLYQVIQTLCTSIYSESQELHTFLKCKISGTCCRRSLSVNQSPKSAYETASERLHFYTDRNSDTQH